MPHSLVSNRQSELEVLSKAELHCLADGLLLDDPLAVEHCVEFVVAKTQGIWHGRARAMMCRRLKHCPLGAAQARLLVSCIVGRLLSGAFSEQFKDQLRLGLLLNPTRLLCAARSCVSSPASHVRRYAEWLLSHEGSSTQPNLATGTSPLVKRWSNSFSFFPDYGIPCSGGESPVGEQTRNRLHIYRRPCCTWDS